jgi:TolA-binding protein
MKKILITSILSLFFTLLLAQETYVYSDPDNYYYEGKELFNQRKFTASIRSFEAYLESKKNTRTDWQQEAEFFLLANAYELRQADVAKNLVAYLNKYPFSTFSSRAAFMLGMLSCESRKYKTALNWFNQVSESQLPKENRSEFLFNKGYAHIENKEFGKAQAIFKNLVGKNTRYEISATYYYAYTEYALRNYDNALKLFLSLENNPEYAKFVPYYIVQIYYYKKEYEKLHPYAEKILKGNPNSPNNAEIYRILGEYYYRNKDYKKAIENLRKYESGVKKVGRNDMYLLGISYYNTNEFANAVQYLSKVTTNDDQMSQNAYLYIGNSYIQLKDKNNARMAFEAAAKKNFDKQIQQEAAYNYALTTYETATGFGESVAAFESFLTNYPNSKYVDNVYEYLASVYLTTNNYEAAYKSLLRLKSTNPRMKEAMEYILFQLGAEAFANAKYDRAIEYFNASLQESTAKSKTAQTYYWLSEAYFRIANYPSARENLIAFFTKNGATSVKEYNLANYNVGYTYFMEKKYGEATPWFQKYITNEKNTSLASYNDALNRLGDCYFNARDFSNAEKYYSQAALKKDGSSDYAAFQKAFVQGLQKNYSGKITALEKLIADYPNSDYVDDAMYEMGRSYVMLNQNAGAINIYKKLITRFPNASVSRKAALEIGMLHYNAGDLNSAITAYKKVIADYPSSEEASTALESLETVYVETNNVEAYLAYTKTLGNAVSRAVSSKEDSLTYVAAERMYMKGNIGEAAIGFAKYLQKNCPMGKYCITARYYLADCYYSQGKYDNALVEYKILSELRGNIYMETVIMRLAEITYNKKDYTSALYYFKQLQSIAEQLENTTAAKIGVLRCSYLLNDNASTIQIANEILADKRISPELATEARYNRAKAYIAQNESNKALPDLKDLASDLRNAAGAEAKYLLANYYFEIGNTTQAENEISDFIKKGTSHQFWLARAFVLLADIYIQKQDDFQAKQYLLSLQANYKIKDSIQELINERLENIRLRESELVD